VPAYGKVPEDYYTGDYRWPVLHNKPLTRRGGFKASQTKLIHARDLGRKRFWFDRRLKKMLETQPEYQTDYDYLIFRF
jgi:hypothetical protein